MECVWIVGILCRRSWFLTGRMIRKCAAQFVARFLVVIPTGGGTTIRAHSAMRRTRTWCEICGLLLLIPLATVAQDHSRVQDTSSEPQTPLHSGMPQRGSTSVVAPNSIDSRSPNRGDSSVAPEPLEQSPADIDLTRRIRRAVLDDESLSPYAHNVKIITHNGQVTLRGPVRSMQEKAAVEEKAASVVGRQNVTNEVEVSPGPGR